MFIYCPTVTVDVLNPPTKMDFILQLLVLLEIVLLVLQLLDGVGSLTVEIIDPAAAITTKNDH
jgi:hypothetical protein